MVMIVCPCEYYGDAWRGERAQEIPVTKSVRLANIYSIIMVV